MSAARSAWLVLLITLVTPAMAAPAPAARPHAADFDTTCAPCRDFDQFANGGWLGRTKLPAGYSNYGAFDELYDRNEAVLRRILEATTAEHGLKSGSDRAKLADYYSSCMDSAGAESAGRCCWTNGSQVTTARLCAIWAIVAAPMGLLPLALDS